MKRTFRDVATIAGLIERNMPGLRKTGRQATFSTDILYDTLRKYDPGHLLLRITRAEAGRGLVDFGRIEEMLARSAGRHRRGARAARHAAGGAAVPRDGPGADRAGAAEARLVREAARRCWRRRGWGGSGCGPRRFAAGRDPAAPGLQLFAPTRTGSGRQRSGKRRLRFATFGRSL